MCGCDFSPLIVYIRKLTGCSPLAQSLYQLICRNQIVTKTQKVCARVVLAFSYHWARYNYAPLVHTFIIIVFFSNLKISVVEGLYLLFRELLPRPGQRTEEKPIEDLDVFEYAAHCWAYLISTAGVCFFFFLSCLVFFSYGSSALIIDFPPLTRISH